MDSKLGDVDVVLQSPPPSLTSKTQLSMLIASLIAPLIAPLIVTAKFARTLLKLISTATKPDMLNYVSRLWGPKSLLKSKSEVKLWMEREGNEADFLVWGILCFPEWQPDVLTFFAPTLALSSIDVDNASASSAHLTKVLYVCKVVISSFSKFAILRGQNENVSQLFDSLLNVKKIKKVAILTPEDEAPPTSPAPRDEDTEKEKIKDIYAAQKLEIEKCRVLINTIFKLSKDLKAMIEDGGRKTD
jgi:hypothetical protein